jgi:hypothetical protein
VNHQSHSYRLHVAKIRVDRARREFRDKARGIMETPPARPIDAPPQPLDIALDRLIDEAERQLRDGDPTPPPA